VQGDGPQALLLLGRAGGRGRHRSGSGGGQVVGQRDDAGPVGGDLLDHLGHRLRDDELGTVHHHERRVGTGMDALDQVRGLREVASGRLRINAPPPAVDLVLAPMVGPFLGAYPQVDLDIVSESGFVDIVSAGYDAGVRYGEHLAQDMVAIPLSGPQSYVVVASPAYLARRGRPKHPKDLLEHDCIRARYSSGVMHDLEFEKSGQVVKVDPPAKLISTNMNLAMRAALDGVGIWATLDGYVGDALKSGALISLMEDWCEPFPGPFLYYPSRRQTPPALRAFIDFVADWRKRAAR